MEESEVRNLIEANKNKIFDPQILKNANIRKCKSGVCVSVYCRGGQFIDTSIALSQLMEILTQLKPNIKHKIKSFDYAIDSNFSVEETW